MARKATNLAEVKVYINGKTQAEKELKELQAASDGFAKSMERARNQMEEASEKMAKAREKTNKYSGNKNSAEYKSAVDELNQAQNDFDEAQKKFIFNEKEWKKYQRLIKESEKLTVDLETALQHLSEQDIATLKKLQRQVDAVRNRVKGEDDPNKEFLNQLNDAFNQIADTIKNKKGDLIEFSDIVKDLTNVDDTSLAKAEQRLRSLLAATDKDDVERVKQLKAELEKTVGERQRRVKVEAQDVQQQVKDNTWKGTIEQTQRAIKLQEEYKQSLKTTDSKSLKAVEETIDGLNKKLEAYQKKQTSSVLKNLDDSSYTQIQAAIEHAKKLQQAAKPGSSAWNNYGRQIANATLYLEKWNDQQKRTKMVEISKQDLGKLSDEDLKQSLRYWDGMVNGIGRTNVAMKQYKEIYDRFHSESSKRADKLMTSVEGGELGGSIDNMERRLKILQEFRGTIDSTKPDAYVRIDSVIEKLKQGIKETKEGFMSFDEAMNKAATLASSSFDGTLEDLEKLQKVIKEGINSELNLSDPADIDRLKEAQKLLEDIAKEQQNAARARLEEQAKDTQSQVKGGTYKGTIEETEKAIELQRQYMKLLDTTDAAGIKDVEDTIEALQQKLKQAKNELMSYKDAMKEVDKMNKGTWKGTLEDLEKIKKSLEYYKKNKLEVGGDTKELKEIEKALREIEKTGRGAHMSMADIDKLIKDLDSASVEQLTIAAKELQDQLQDAVRGTQEYAETAAKLREVNLELKKAKKEWEGQENVIVRTAKRLAAYVAVYGGFNEIMGKMKEVVNMNLQLSDSMADVQKTTGLTGVELQELGRSLERIDTRTTTAELYQLAAAAGQIGLKTQEDVLGFAKAANTISVALNELGAEGSASLMKIATLTGEVERYGTEQALTRVGSAINELTANSAATAGPIADFISRVGGIASASKLAISEMAALGAAADASGQSIEIAGTSMNKLISAITSNTENIAYAANISVAELEGLINQGETMQAIIRVLESMEGMDRGAANELMKELGSEGARMNQYVSSMVANLDLLKQQLNISREAFDENVSIINEYNVKQESALGILQRMKNSFMDTFVNSKMTVILRDVLEYIAAIPDKLEKLPGLLLVIKVAIAEILLLNVPLFLHNLMSQLSGLYRILAGPTMAAITAFRHAWKQAELELVFGGKAVNGLTIAFRVLGNVIKTHPVLFIASIVTAGIVAFNHFRNKIDEVTKAMAELDEKHARQIEELNALRAALESTNASYTTRLAAMKEINSLYSKYLGFELSELDVYSKKAKALDYINAKLKENQALEQENRQKEVYTQEFGKESKDELETIRKVFSSIPEITATRVPEAMEIMNHAIKNGAKDYTKILQDLADYFQSDKIPHYNAFFDNKDEFNEYIRLYTQFQTDITNTEKAFGNLRTHLQNKSNEELWKVNKDQFERIQALQADNSERSEEEQRNYWRTLLKEQEEYLKTSEQLFEVAKAQDANNIKAARGEDDIFDIEALRRNVSEATAVRAEGMNKMKEENAALKEIFDKAKNDIKDYEKQIADARLTGADENQIQQLETLMQEAITTRDNANKTINENEAKWLTEWTNLHTKNASEVKLQWLEVVESTKSAIEEIKAAIEGDPFGKLLNLRDWKNFDEIINSNELKNANPASLVNVYKKLREDYLKMSGDLTGLNKMFDFEVPMTSLEQAQTQIFSWAEQLRNELRRRGLTTTGMMIASDTQSQVDNALNKLKTHFIKRQAEIRDSFINGTISSAEMNRQIEANDQELLKARIELRKRLNNEESYLKQALYPELNDVDIQKIVNSVGTADSEVRDKLKADLEEDGNALREGLIAIRQKIESELLAIDPFRGLDDKFQTSLDELNLMSSQFERDQAENLREFGEKFVRDASGKIMGLDKETQRNRLEFLMKISKQAYTVDADGLREMMKSHEDYYNWIGNLDDQELQIMLAKLQKFYDDALVAQDNYANRIRKSAKASYDQQGLKLGELGEIEWEIDEHVKKRDQLRKRLLSDEAKTMTKEEQKSIQDRIAGYNIAINRAEEDRDKILDKLSKQRKQKNNEREREAKEEMEASISALEAYYNEQEALIRKRALENGSTQATLEREIRKNNLKREQDEIQLRKKLLGEASTFDPNANEGYKGVITGTTFFGNTRDLNKQAEQIKVWGKALMDGMRNQIAKGEITIQEALQKQKDKIEKILLEDDFSGKVMHEYAEAIDELGLLFNVNETLADSDEELGKARLTYMREWSKDAYAIDAAGLEERIKSNELFSEWVKDRSKEDYEALLVQLRKFNNDVEEADKKAADRRKKIFDNSKKGIEIKNQGEANEKQAENDSEMWKRFQGFDLVSENAVDRAQIELYQEKIQSSMLYIDQIKMEMMAERLKASTVIAGIKAEIAARKAKGLDVSQQQAALLEAEQAYNSLVRQEQIMTMEAQQNIAEQRALIADTEMSIEQRKIEKMKQYTDAVVDFAGKMTEAEWDDVESRKEAGRELIKTLLTLLKNQIQIWTTELVMKKMFAQQSTSTTAGQVGSEMTLKAAETEADIVAGTASATAKEAGKKGWIGLAVGAAIGAALSALLGLAMNAINKTKSVADSMSGSKKLSTGMLTYAEGNYPVLGNDGKVYDAKYEGAGMKTGVYGGGAHFGIFSEKQPEMIVDGKTTQKIILNYPYIYDAITTIAKNGRLKNAMPTFAIGDYPAGMNRIAQVETMDVSGGANPDMERMNAALEMNSAVLAKLNQILVSGQISANVDPYANNKATKRAERFMKRRGIG